MSGNKPSYKELEKRVKLLEKQVEIFDKLLEISPFYIFFKDRDIKPIKLSKNYEDLLKVPVEQAIGKPMSELFPIELAENMVKDDTIVLKNGKTVEVVEELENRIYYTIKFPITLKDNSVILGGFTIDETDKIKAERALKELNSTKDSLFSIIAHDLRSPFNSILGFSEILVQKIKQGDYEKTVKYSDNINSSAKDTLNLLENLMDWAKTQTGQIEFSPQYITLSQVYDQALELVEANARNKEITLSYFESEKIDVFADVDLLRTVLRNLISNAIKYSNIRSKVEVFAIKEDDKVEITVTDNGIGMDNDTLHKLFIFDTRLKTEGTANEKGSGLGLLICKNFIEKHKGAISIASQKDKGTEVKLTIPVA